MLEGTLGSKFVGIRCQLEDFIDVEHGLLTKLLDYNVITRRHRRAINVNCVITGKLGWLILVLFLAECCSYITSSAIFVRCLLSSYRCDASVL